MYTEIQKFANLIKGKQGMYVKVVCTGIFSASSYAALNSLQYQTIPYGFRKLYTAWNQQTKAKCQSTDAAMNSTGKNSEMIYKKEKPVHEDGSTKIKPPENEFRIILLGATGSGRSSAGNHLLKNKEGFKTSCYVNSETQKSTLRTLTWGKDSKTYKIDIIDTPANVNTRLRREDVECEIKKAIALSAPGPHAFLVCIPATSSAERYEEVLEPYKRYFKDISDFIVITLTRYDQFKSECCNERGQEFDFAHLHALTGKMKDDLIILRNNDHGDNTADLLNKIIKSMEQRKQEFASCKLSTHAEEKLQETIININEYPTIMNISRDIVKMIPNFLNHFAQRCCFVD